VANAAVLHSQLAELACEAHLSARQARLLEAAVLLWHDHLDASHRIVQAIEDADGSYVHAIMHRREPDYANAKYWFRRVGPHACFAELLKRVKAHLEHDGSRELAAALTRDGQWDPYAFVDECQRCAIANVDAGRSRLLRNVQRIEFEVLLEHLCA
jgi:hypothetical protein